MLRKLIRARETGLYLCGDGTFTDDVELAVNIDSVAQAMSLCRDHRLKDAELVYWFPDGERAVPIPLL